MPDIEHEKRIISILLNELSKRNNFVIENVEYPEEFKPLSLNPIDSIYYTTKEIYVIEHTILETYKKQKTEDHKLLKILEELKKDIENSLNIKGKFTLVLPPGKFYDIKVTKMINSIKSWIYQTAPKLKEGNPRNAPDHYICENIESIDFTICLQRWPCLTTEFQIERFAPDDIRDCLDGSVENRLYKKMNKLNEWKIRKNAISILILESLDFPLADL